MAGKIKEMIDAIIMKRSGGIARLAYTTKTRLMIKGIDPDAYDEQSKDDPFILEKLKQFAIELNIDIYNQ